MSKKIKTSIPRILLKKLEDFFYEQDKKDIERRSKIKDPCPSTEAQSSNCSRPRLPT